MYKYTRGQMRGGKWIKVVLIKSSSSASCVAHSLNNIIIKWWCWRSFHRPGLLSALIIIIVVAAAANWLKFLIERAPQSMLKYLTHKLRTHTIDDDSKVGLLLNLFFQNSNLIETILTEILFLIYTIWCLLWLNLYFIYNLMCIICMEILKSEFIRGSSHV